MIDTIPLFPLLDLKLIELLRTLSAADWDKPTVARLWSVKDVAAHLLDGNIRMLSFSRDSHKNAPDREINSYQDLVGYLNQFNADWVKACKRVSPGVLVELLESTGKQYSEHVATLNPYAEAMFSVAWAGEEKSVNWFHIAREYTEKWHHQQQIREAVDKPGIITPMLFPPFIETLLLGLPHTYRNIQAKTGTTIEIGISSESGGNWYLVKQDQGWKTNKTSSSAPDAGIIISPDTAWKLFTKAITPEKARETATLSGNIELAEVALTMVAVMA